MSSSAASAPHRGPQNRVLGMCRNVGSNRCCQLTKIGNASLGMQYEISAVSRPTTTRPCSAACPRHRPYPRCRMAKRSHPGRPSRGADASPGSTDMMQRNPTPPAGQNLWLRQRHTGHGRNLTSADRSECPAAV
jgi:hypothetical protein